MTEGDHAKLARLPEDEAVGCVETGQLLRLSGELGIADSGLQVRRRFGGPDPLREPE